MARVFTIDLPGHGKSAGTGQETTEAYAATLVEFCEALELGRVVVVGHSLGGAIAQKMAILYPDVIAGLILIGTGSKLPVAPDLPQRILEAPEVTIDWIVEHAWHASADHNLRQLSKDRMRQTLPEVLCKDFRACQTFDTREQLHQIAVPTLVIGSTSDRMVRFDFSVTLADNIHNARLVPCDDAGHMITLEKPAFVTDTVTQWLLEQSWPTT